MTSQNSISINGIIPPLITPLTETKALDFISLSLLLEHIIKGGVHGVFILGTTGESASLSMGLKVNLIEETIKIVKDRIPVLVGVTDSSFEVSVELADLAHKLGATAVVSAPPFYYKLSQNELISYYKKLAERSRLPVYLYNMPSHTKITFEIDTIKELSNVPNIAGLKDSSGNAPYFQKLIHLFKDRSTFKLFVGPEETIAETVLMGGDGGVPGGANLFPELYVALYDAAIRKDHSRTLLLHNLVMRISSKIYNMDNNQSSYLKGLKGALSTFGLCKDYLAEPIEPYLGKDKDNLKERVNEIKNELSEII
ncbi:dihydrodipicolinate synthase family protein [Flavimarina sp. Hel_I_48]|uniref:dihydrodipicolinate synthase family protein n=1 Tax=Flavimarina sp. Hel_I_48 TaxID=1392488 RepID=UPI0004DF09D9|nr:dihydrodipicolinate synthase family protein [Flavimarina sp. Hel_I_48]